MTVLVQSFVENKLLKKLSTPENIFNYSIMLPNYCFVLNFFKLTRIVYKFNSCVCAVYCEQIVKKYYRNFSIPISLSQLALRTTSIIDDHQLSLLLASDWVKVDIFLLSLHRYQNFIFGAYVNLKDSLKNR